MRVRKAPENIKIKIRLMMKKNYSFNVWNRMNHDQYWTTVISSSSEHLCCLFFLFAYFCIIKMNYNVEMCWILMAPMEQFCSSCKHCTLRSQKEANSIKMRKTTAPNLMWYTSANRINIILRIRHNTYIVIRILITENT